MVYKDRYKCDHCKNFFKREPSKIEGKKNIFCSINCHNKFRLKHIYECEVCEKVFHRPVRLNQKVRFCSKGCMYKKLKKERNPFNCKCKECGKRFHKSKSAIKAGEGKYCSFECKRIYATGKGKWLNGKAKYPHYYARPNWKKKRLKALKIDNYECQLCGLKPKKHSRLQVHHKKRRTKGGTDDLDNLITLCFSCHKIVDGRLY